MFVFAGEHAEEIVLETPHPYPGGDRVFLRTVHVPGATHLAICFDPRSSTCAVSNQGASDVVKCYRDAAMSLPLDGELGPFSGPPDEGAWNTHFRIIPGNTLTLEFNALYAGCALLRRSCQSTNLRMHRARVRARCLVWRTALATGIHAWSARSFAGASSRTGTLVAGASVALSVRW